MKTFTILHKQIIFLLFTMIFIPNVWSEPIHPFDKVNPADTYNIQGNYAIAGNTVMCLTENTSGYGGTCHGMDDYEYITSNMHVSKYIDIDSDSSTWNSTSSYITIPDTFDAPPGKGILWAGLFWQGRISTDNDYDMHYGVENGSSYNFIATGKDDPDYTLPSDFKTTGANKIKLKVDKGNYGDVTADTLYEYSSSGGTTYAAYADVTNIVNTIQTSGKHVFTVADLTTNEGREGSPGVFGGWSLVVIYAENSFGTMRNISVYSGFDKVHNPSDPFTITDFILPKSNDVNATLSLFSGEGEYLYGYNPDNLNAYDWVKISPDDNNYSYMPDAEHDKNIFDAVFSGITRDDITGESNNLQVNNDGVDVDTFDVSSLMTKYRDADPELNTLYIQWSSNQDYVTPSMITFATELYAPKFCYDYAYKQQGVYFTEPNDGTQMPRLSGDVLTNEPIELTIFIRNLVDSDLEVTDMNVSVLNLNTSHTTYIRDTTKLATIGDLIPQDIPDSSLIVSDSYIRNIMIGTIKSNEYFYVYYSLNPLISDLNDSIDVKANYNLTLNGVTVPYQLQLGQSMQICSTSNFKYRPERGIFNIVHEDYYKLDENSNSNEHYYNLPTQVTAREGNFKLLVIDPDDPEYNTLLTDHNILYTDVEMIDASAFHDTNASCYEGASSISERVGLLVDANVTSYPFNKTTLQYAINNGFTSLAQTSDFYLYARRNAAFRVTYYENAYDDNNQPAYKKNDDGTYEATWDMDWKGENCVGDVNQNGESNNNDKVSNYCQDGHSLQSSNVVKCTRCVSHAKYICSRDNFSIRPEAFNLKIDDQNQSTPSNQITLTNGYTGNVGATAPVLDLAAGYKYNLEINATTHKNNAPSYGYTRSFNLATPKDIAKYTWEPGAAIMAAGTCNDEDNTSLEIRFLNGQIDTNTSVAQVGEYRLNLLDTTWTAVDSDSSFMAHHTGYYFASGLDCLQSSSTTQTLNSSTLNGCYIGSSHTNPTTNVKYNDFSIIFHPYALIVSNILKIGPSSITPPTTLPFVYMANINNNENMSVHLETTITAIGKDTLTPLSNFVAGCYEEPLHITIKKSPTKNTNLAYNYRFHDLNASDGSVLSAYNVDSTIPAGNINDDANLTTLNGTFQTNLRGTIYTQTNLNFQRAKNKAVNPEEITFISYKVASSNAFHADLTNKTAEGGVSLNNQKIIYYYGRTNAPRKTIVCRNSPCLTHYDPNSANNPDHTRIYVYDEIYCYKTKDGNTCDDTLLPAGTTNSSDLRWWINLNQDQNVTAKTDGEIGSVKEIAAANVVEVNQAMIYKYQYETVLKYSGPSFPYTANMENNASDWLLYDELDANTSTNKFRVDFINASDWNGVHETNTTTFTNGAVKTNRRLMW